MERDFWDILALVATISTGVVIAIAASLAFIVQRARYFREIEPVVTLGTEGQAYASLVTPTIASVSLAVNNARPNHLTNLRLDRSTLNIFQLGGSHHSGYDKKSVFVSVPPGGQVNIRLQIQVDEPDFPFDSPETHWVWTGTVAFSPRLDAALILMNPWSWGSISSKIDFTVNWSWYAIQSGGNETLPRLISFVTSYR